MAGRDGATQSMARQRERFRPGRFLNLRLFERQLASGRAGRTTVRRRAKNYHLAAPGSNPSAAAGRQRTAQGDTAKGGRPPDDGTPR
jgi:hypothetical protein